jgi:DNA-binding response OmpR family regulator
MLKILLVEDSEESKDLVLRALEGAFDVHWVGTILAAKSILQTQTFDLLLLDLGLPDGDGFQFFSEIKGQTPVIVLTAKNDLPGKVLGFSMGVEDYIVKPFEPMEFKARIESRLKKLTGDKAVSDMIQNGSITLYLSSQRTWITAGKTKNEIPLTPLEFKILALLVKNEDKIFSRNQLLDSAWGDGVNLTDRAVDTHICTLRKKMGLEGERIQSVYGQGYRLVSELTTYKVSGKKAA